MQLAPIAAAKMAKKCYGEKDAYIHQASWKANKTKTANKNCNKNIGAALFKW